MLISAPLCAKPEAFEITAANLEELPGGRESDAIIGDFILRNDKVEAVISQNAPLRRPNMSTFYGADGETPGCLYDLSLRGAKNDQLTIFTPGNQRGRVSWVRIIEDGSKGEAVIETVVTAALGKGIAIRHEYRIKDGLNGLFITSTYENTTGGVIEREIKDGWTNFLSNHGIHGRYHWAESVDPADRCGYAFGWLEPREDQGGIKLKLEPGKPTTVRRFLSVGTSPAEAMGRLAEQFGEAGRIQIAIAQEDKQPVRDAFARIVVTGETRMVAYPNDKGVIAIPFPAGAYDVSVEAPGRPMVSLPKIEAAAQATPVPVTLGARSAIAFEITDEAGAAMPCKVQFHSLGGTASVNLGPNIRARGCLDQWHSENGKFEAPLQPGSYRLIVTRGPEYGHYQQEVTLAAGQTLKVATKLKRLVDTKGWISADFHNHSTPSGDNVCGTDDRVINLAAEHIEFAPTTEHNRIYNWAPHIERLGLTPFLSTIPGMELTGSGAHMNSFPLKAVPYTQDHGAPVWENNPVVNSNHLRDLGGYNPKRWTQINHPDMVENFFDRNKDKARDGGFTLLAGHINAVETQNYRTSEILYGAPFRIGDPLKKGSRVDSIREFIWLQLLNQGARVWGVAVADAHAVHGNGVGGWRVYLPSDTDDPAKANWETLVDHARAGHMYLSSGPFLEVGLDGKSILPGETIVPAAKSVPVKIKVQTTDWVKIDRVQVLVNGRQEPSLNFTRKANPDMFQDGVVQFDRTVTANLKEDAHLIVVAIGENSTLVTGFGTSGQSSIHPCAYNNPIFVDIDGNGFVPNGDTLGYDLPVGGMSVDEAKAFLEKNR